MLLRWHTPKLELNHDARPRHLIKTDAPSHPPQQDTRIKFVLLRIAKGPARAPGTKQIDQLLQLSPSPRQSIIDAQSARGGAPFHHAGVYKSAQPLGQKRARDAGKTTLEVVEIRDIGKYTPLRSEPENPWAR